MSLGLCVGLTRQENVWRTCVRPLHWKEGAFKVWFTFENCVADSTRRQFQCCISTHGRTGPYDSRYTTVSALAGHDHAKPTTPNNRRHMSRVCQRALDIFDAASRMNAHLHRALRTTGPDLVRHSSSRRLAQRSWSLSMVHHDRYRTLHCPPHKHMSRLSSRTGRPFSREQARIQSPVPRRNTAAALRYYGLFLISPNSDLHVPTGHDSRVKLLQSNPTPQDPTAIHHHRHPRCHNAQTALATSHCRCDRENTPISRVRTSATHSNPYTCATVRLHSCAVPGYTRGYYPHDT